MPKGSGFVPTKATLLTIMLCSMLMLMGGAAVAPALPLIEQVFVGQDTLVSMIITIPSLAVGLVGFGMGALADRFGKVRVLGISLVVFTLAGAFGFLMDGSSQEQLYILLVARFVVGIGIAGISSAVTALIAEYYAGIDRVKALSYQAAAMGVGVLILEYTGGLLAELSWREPFLVYLIGVPILLMVLLTMREPSRDSGEETESRAPERKADGRLLVICYATIFIAMTMAFLLPTKMPTYLQTELAVSASVTGLFLGVHGVTNACVSLMYRRIVQRMAPFTLIAGGLVHRHDGHSRGRPGHGVPGGVQHLGGGDHGVHIGKDHGRVQHQPQLRAVRHLADQRPAVRRRRELLSGPVRGHGRGGARGGCAVHPPVQAQGSIAVGLRERSSKWKPFSLFP